MMRTEEVVPVHGSDSEQANEHPLYFRSTLSHTACVLCIQPERKDGSLYHRVPGQGQTAPCTPQGLVRRLSGRLLLPEERRSGTSSGSTLPNPLPGLFPGLQEQQTAFLWPKGHQLLLLPLTERPFPREHSSFSPAAHHCCRLLVSSSSSKPLPGRK